MFWAVSLRKDPVMKRETEYPDRQRSMRRFEKKNPRVRYVDDRHQSTSTYICCREIKSLRELQVALDSIAIIAFSSLILERDKNAKCIKLY